MEGAILHTDSDKDLKLILQLAKKLGISIKKLTSEELEDFGLAKAVTEGRSEEYIENESFQKDIQRINSNALNLKIAKTIENVQNSKDIHQYPEPF